jgi:hypothetical protein
MNSVKWALPGGKQDFETLIINIRETTNTLCDITNYQVLEELMSAVVFSKARSLQEAFEIGEATADAKSLLQMVADMRAKVIEIDLIISKSAYYFEPERLYPRQGSRKQLNEWRSATNEQYDRFDRWQEHVSKEFGEQTVAKWLSSNGVDVQQQYKHGHEVAQYERSLILRRWVEDTTIFWGGRSGLSSERLSEIREGHRQCIAAVASQLHHIHRTQWTSGLEPKWIRTLDCAGYFYEELATEKYDRFSYAFLLPSHLQTAESVTCLTFTDCLLKLQKPPTLDIQKKLATALARTVFGVQLAGLLHKSFNPDNIIFFARNGDVEEATILAFLSEPYVVGFELARPDHRPDFSLVPAEVNLYTHPAYSVKRHFMPSFDVHSLGLILLSIGLWRPLESLWGEFIAYCDQQRKSRPETKVFLPGRATPGDLRKYSSNFEDDMFEHSLERFRNLDYQGWCLKAKEYSHPNEFERVKERYVKFLLTKIDSLSTLCSAEWADAVRWCIKTAQEKEYSVKALFERVVQVFDEPDP